MGPAALPAQDASTTQIRDTHNRLRVHVVISLWKLPHPVSDSGPTPGRAGSRDSSSTTADSRVSLNQIMQKTMDHMKNIGRNILRLASMAALSGPAFAQQPVNDTSGVDAAEEFVELEEFVVEGFRASMAKSLELKRESGNLGRILKFSRRVDCTTRHRSAAVSCRLQVCSLTRRTPTLVSHSIVFGCVSVTLLAAC